MSCDQFISAATGGGQEMATIILSIKIILPINSLQIKVILNPTMSRIIHRYQSRLRC